MILDSGATVSVVNNLSMLTNVRDCNEDEITLTSIHVRSAKQRLVTKSSAEAELVALSEEASQVIWCREFLLQQGYKIGAAVIFQDNTSAVAMAMKGIHTSPRTRHINIRHFFIKDRISSGEIKIERKPTGSMLADIMTKALQGMLFKKFRSILMDGLTCGECCDNRVSHHGDGKQVYALCGHFRRWRPEDFPEGAGMELGVIQPNDDAWQACPEC